MRFLVAGLLVLLTSTAAAQPPANYYATVTTQTGEDLKLELRAIVSGQRDWTPDSSPFTVRSISYDAARDALLTSVDNVGNGLVRLIYTNEQRSTSLWGTSIDREHVWPQSFGSSTSPLKSDMHHLFLCDKSINSSRGNDFFGFVTGGTPSPNPVGGAANQNFSLGSVWEVSPNHRGDVARAVFYMDTRYSQLRLIRRGESAGSTTLGYLDDLIQWHDSDPPDAFEVERNNRVFTFQNNRNPYIDNPSYVNRVYGGGSTVTAPTLTAFGISPSSPTSGVPVTVSVNATDPEGIQSVTLFARVGTSGPFASSTMTGGPVYVGTIAPQAPETLVQYYVAATDTTAQTAFAPFSGATAPASYLIPGDLPILTGLSISPASPDPTSTVSISATVTDDDGDTAANLTVTAYWRIAGAPSFAAIPMSLASGVWTTTSPIPAQPVDATVEYYVEAVDLGAATASIPPGGAASPASFFVEEAAPFVLVDSGNYLSVAGKLMISEFAHRINTSALLEYVELVNTSETTGYILTNVGLSDNAAGGDTAEASCRFPAGFTIPPGGIAVIFHRSQPDQTYVDSIPVLSNRNGAAVQVAVLDGGTQLTFNGSPVPEMISLSGLDEIQLANGGDNIALYLVTGSGDTYAAADVIDGVGYGDGGGDATNWSATVSTTGSANNVVATNQSSGSNGAFRISPVDTNSRTDWQDGLNALTPGFLPATYELDRTGLIVSGASYSGGVLTITEGAASTLLVRLDENPGRVVSVSLARLGGSETADLFNVSGATAFTFDTTNWNVDQSVAINKGVDPNTAIDEATYQFTGNQIESLSFTAREVETATVHDWPLY